MGAMQNNQIEKKKRGSGRGSVNNARRLDALVGGEGKRKADWGEVVSDKLQTVVVMITALGGAVTFGLSRDKGAHSITLMLDGERETLWFNRDADLDEELDTVAATLAAIE